MFHKVARHLLKHQRAFYSTQEKINIVHVPKRYEIPLNTFALLDDAIDTAPTCKTLAVLIKVSKLL